MKSKQRKKLMTDRNTVEIILHLTFAYLSQATNLQNTGVSPAFNEVPIGTMGKMHMIRKE